MSWKKFKAWFSVHKFTTSILLLSMLAIIIIPPSVVCTLNNKKQTNNTDNENSSSSNEDHFANADVVNINLPNSNPFENTPINLVNIQQLLSDIPINSTINGVKITVKNYKLYNLDAEQWNRVIGSSSQFKKSTANNTIQLSNLSYGNKNLPNVTISTFLDATSTQKIAYSSKIYLNNLPPNYNNNDTKGDNVYSYQYTVLDIIDTLSTNQIFGITNEATWAQILETGQIQYQSSDIELSNLYYQQVSLPSIQITGFNDNNELSLNSLLSDYNQSTLSNNFSNVYSLQYPLIYTNNKFNNSNFNVKYNIASILANSYNDANNPAPEPQVSEEINGKYYVTNGNLINNLQFWTSFFWNENNVYEDEYMDAYNSGQITNDVSFASNSSSSSSSTSTSSSSSNYVYLLPNPNQTGFKKLSPNKNFYEDVNYFSSGTSEITINQFNIPQTTLTLDLNKTIKTFSYNDISYSSFQLTGFNSYNTSNNNNTVDITLNLNNLLNQNVAKELNDVYPWQYATKEYGINGICVDNQLINLYWLINKSSFNLCNVFFNNGNNWNWDLSYSTTNLTNLLNPSNSGSSSSSSSSSSSNSSSSSTSSTNSGELIITSLNAYDPSNANNIQNLKIIISGFKDFNNYCSLNNNKTLYNFALSNDDLLNILNENKILGLDDWDINQLNNCSIYTLSNYNFFTPTNNLYTFNSQIQNAIAIQFPKQQKITQNANNELNSNPLLNLNQSISSYTYPTIYITGFLLNSNLSSLNDIFSNNQINLENLSNYINTNKINYYEFLNNTNNLLTPNNAYKFLNYSTTSINLNPYIASSNNITWYYNSLNITVKGS